MQWVSVKDKPPLGSFVLAHFNNGRIKIMQYACISEQFVGEGDVVCQKCFTVQRKDCEHYITHWMPLPEPPEK